MAIDTPARIAILGAGPIGLEAALYARFLGYDVDVYERGRIAENVQRWGHVRMFSPFGMNRSPLGLAALTAQSDPSDASHLPGDDAILTGQEWFEHYLRPLANSDLLIDHLHLRSTVIAIGKEGVLKQELVGDEERGDWPFRLLIRDGDGLEQVNHADAVIDTTGVYGNPNWLGTGGIPALGEFAVRDRIEYGLPDVLGADRETFSGKHSLVVGAGHGAATTITNLAALAREAPGTRITWVTRAEPSADQSGPIREVVDDRLPVRAQLARAANACLHDGSLAISHLAQTTVESVHYDEASGTIQIELGGQHAGPCTADRIVANVGYRPNGDLYDELQVHRCYATDGPMKLAASLMKQTSTDCLDQRASGPECLFTPEPNFYILGAKSFGRRSNFLVSLGLEQVRDLFRIIGDRPTLDLYAGPHHLPK